MHSAELTVPQAARYMGVTDGRVRQMIGLGQLDARKTNGRWLVAVASIQACRAKRGWALAMTIAEATQ